jgi:hypothetical protein
MLKISAYVHSTAKLGGELVEDYYKILGVPYNASADDIKSAYRTLAKRWHPDVCKEPGAHEQFVKIGEAYEILSNPRTRLEYDQIRAYEQSGYAGYAGQSYSSQGYSTYSEKAENFSQAQQTARQQAEANARKPLEELLELLMAVGSLAVAAGVAAGRVAWKGEPAVQEERYSFGTRMAIGFKGSLLLLVIILSFTGVAIPLTLPIGFIVYKSLTHNRRFIGIGTLLGSTILFLFITALVILLLFAMFNPFS